MISEKYLFATAGLGSIPPHPCLPAGRLKGRELPMSLPFQRLCHKGKRRGRGGQVPCLPAGRQIFRMRVFYIMENYRLYKIQRFHMLVTLESERLKVTALNLFHPTASPPFQQCVFFILRHTLFKGEVRRGMGFSGSLPILRLEQSIGKVRV